MIKALVLNPGVGEGNGTRIYKFIALLRNESESLLLAL